MKLMSARLEQMNERSIDVLFVCIHNSGRSVAAKALFNHRVKQLGLELNAESAGTQPSSSINPRIAKILESFQLDVALETPKLLTNGMLANGPIMITIGCDVDAVAYPALRPSEADDWALPDPSSMAEDEIVPLVHEIARRVNVLIHYIANR